ncbi:acyl-CoA dehydratase activase-related protein [Olsenella profusa]|uniref:DUF2229 domain-containing protein n=1 Tax=Olsenella profusa TaxID=138595 RepID=A0ABS2EZM5_9ACTN|nr:acyl-CoA dehydratase activase-related protein [Olsenella profusa]MBM6774164.1 hypothetical protein [Olsenella profusa]
MPSDRKLAALPTQAAPLADAHVIGLPRALMYYRLGTKWRAFFEALGREVRVSKPSDRAVFERGEALSVDECCLASKLYLGHVDELADRVDAVFCPSLARPSAFRTYCTKFQALPDLVSNAFALAERPVTVLSELLWEDGAEKDERESYVRLAARLGASRKEGVAAWKQARRAQADHDDKLARAQADLVRSAARLPEGERAIQILVAAHPYVAHDPYVGGVVTDALRANGATVLFADEYDHERAYRRSQDFSASLPWVVNRELVGAILALHEEVDGIVLISAFPCGPDSMTDDAISRCVKGRPLLTLTVDAQSGTAGVETRVESFVDILSYQRKGGYLNG